MTAILTAGHDIAQLGQVFTPDWVVDQMLELRQNHGRALEPAAGAGAFLDKLEPTAVGLEIDPGVATSRALHGDFFDYPRSHQFDTIIGNPPYVRHQDIPLDIKSKLASYGYDARTNLYVFFIDKCLDHLADHGELIFITPRDFLKSTSARQLNQKLYECGSMTHYFELGDQRVFDGFSPNCAIWRWEQGRTDRAMVTAGQLTSGQFMYSHGQLWFGSGGEGLLSDYFDVKVGAVSGADAIYANEAEGNLEFVCSRTAATGQLRRMIYNEQHECLRPHKQALLNRKIRQFDESNWWEWGRKFCDRPGPRVYVNAKTRNPQPFFASEVRAYDGSVLALFPKSLGFDVWESAEKLNAVDWEQLGFVCDGRHIFSQKSLAHAPVEF